LHLKQSKYYICAQISTFNYMSNNSDQKVYIEEDEITLKELILKLQEFWQEALRYWWVIAVFGFGMAGYMAYSAYTTPTTYVAKTSFIVNEDDGGGSPIAGILGQFGLGGNKSEYNLDKILALSKTSKIVFQSILEKETIGIGGKDGVEDVLANHIINEYPEDFDEYWADLENDSWVGYRFIKDSLSQFNRVDNAAIQRVKAKVIGSKTIDPIFAVSYEEETGIMSMTLTSTNEELSMVLIDNLYTNLSRYYIEHTTGPKRDAFKKLKAEVDSLNAVITSKEYELGRFLDQRNALLFNSDKLRREKLAQEIQGLYGVYMKSLEQQKVAEFSLKTATPFFEVIEQPMFPLTKNIESLIKAIVIGGIIGGFLGVFFVSIRKIYIDTMNNPV